MPTYSYACAACAERFEAVQSIHDDALTECPECGGAVRRVISAVGVSFKGSGFYRTDSRDSSKKSAPAKSGASSGSSAVSSSSSGSNSGSPAKPASPPSNAGASPA